MHLRLAKALAASLLCLTSSAVAAQGIVLAKDNSCNYKLLVLPSGQMAVFKSSTNRHLQNRDVLSGNFSDTGFTQVTKVKTGERFDVWIDSIDSATQALSSYSSYCG